ncbi:MAG: OmpA family protein [Boseongicola sp.]|nr:OmpA family protein [Boseongicola sp.]MDD9977809.1 OmpA family protein [Boseongicola sp.]
MSRRRLNIRAFVPHAIAIVVAGAACLGVAFWAKGRVEQLALTDIDLVLSQNGHDWAEATANGLQVTLFGTAPDEATRFAALSAAGRVVDASRIQDAMEVAAVAKITPPAFSIEILKNDDGVSLIGLIPAASNPEAIVERIQDISDGSPITDLLEVADFDPPAGWDRALEYGLRTVDTLPRSKVSITPASVAVTAVAEDIEDQQRIERNLKRNAPAGLGLNLNITAPLPVITPFTIRFLIDEDGARFDACSADTETARQAILAAATKAGMTGGGDCPLGLGAPSTSWADAAVSSIETLAALGQGTLTISNADVSLIAAEGTSEALFDRQVGALENDLPAVFSLSSVRLVPETDEPTDVTVPEFVATRSPEGLVQLRGRLSDARSRNAVVSFAEAHFGSSNVRPATRLGEGLPQGWPNRVLASLESLSLLSNGIATVTPDEITISGKTGRKDARAEASRILASRLQDGARFSLDITYSEALDPLAGLPTPEECIEQINSAASSRKISFAPSSADIEDAAVATIDTIAEILRDCQSARIEIGGHTDSQGREVMNQQLSQARADAVLNAIMARRVLVSNLSAKGYGESSPIADNDTEEGREANRRIEFRLVLSEQADDNETGAADEAATEGEASE